MVDSAERHERLDYGMDPRAKKGSEPWARAAREVMQMRLQKGPSAMHGAKDIGEEFIKYRGWAALGFKTFEEFVSAPYPDGLGPTDNGDEWEYETIEPLIVQAFFGGDRSRFKVATVPEEDIQRKANQYTSASDNITGKRGTDPSYLARRLKRDHPAIYERLLRGAFRSVRKAAIEAGIVKVPTPFETAQKAIRKLSEDEREALVKWIYAEASCSLNWQNK